VSFAASLAATLIFFAAALCCCEEDPQFVYTPAANLSVYGDDVILPSSSFSRFSELCDFYGFVINEDKSFVNSDFRESCGSHFYRGLDCKPIYLKDSIKTISDVFLFYNGIRRLSRMHYGCDERFKLCCDNILFRTPSRLRLRIPDGYGDGGFIGNLDEATPQRNRHWIEGFNCVTLKTVSRRFGFDGEGLLLNSLWSLEGQASGSKPGAAGVSLGKTSMGNFVSRRGETTLKLSRDVVGVWTDLGPWF